MAAGSQEQGFTMEDRKTERVHVALAPAALIDLDDYAFVARKVSRSDTIRYLVRIALNGEVPPAHVTALKRMLARQRERSPKANATLLNEYKQKFDRAHITLSSNDRKDIEAYRSATTIGTRAETIRYLIGLSLEGSFSREHLDILKRLEAQASIRDKAHQIWEAAGRPEGMAEEHWARAEAELAAEEATKKQRLNPAQDPPPPRPVVSEARRQTSNPTSVVDDVINDHSGAEFVPKPIGPGSGAGETSDTPDRTTARMPYRPAPSSGPSDDGSRR